MRALRSTGRTGSPSVSHACGNLSIPAAKAMLSATLFGGQANAVVGVDAWRASNLHGELHPRKRAWCRKAARSTAASSGVWARSGLRRERCRNAEFAAHRWNRRRRRRPLSELRSQR